MWKLIAVSVLSITASLLLMACTGRGDDAARPQEDGPESTPPVLEASPPSTDEPIGPPLEGPIRPALFNERTNYRELPEFQLPTPEDVPEPADDAKGPEYTPPAEPSCPEDWLRLLRPGEGFDICYPQDWRIDGHGNVSSGWDDRWYSVGLFLFEGAGQLAHVSIYVMNAYAQPFPYTRDCEQPYRVSFSGQPAVLCPDYSGQFPEGKIIAYHARVGEIEYFVNAVVYHPYDSETGRYLDSWSKEIEDEAIRVAQTFHLIGSAEAGE